MSFSVLIDRSFSEDGSPTTPPHRRPALQTRFLTPQDIRTLLRLETRQWGPEQAADEQTLLQRIHLQPDLCVGSFCGHTGEAVSSLFMRPIRRAELAQLKDWTDGANLSTAGFDPTRSLFGISLTSVEPEGAAGMVRFFWPHALKHGWRDIYLGSPIPGLQEALRRDPRLTVKHYVFGRKRGLPRDPQLRYYHRKGFRDIVAIKPGYFPHEPSLDHGVLLRGAVPLAWLWPVWRMLPLPWLRSMSRWAEGAL